MFMNRLSAIFLCICVCLTSHTANASDSWYAGSWDSTIYNRSEKPTTVALRIEVMDSETGIAVSGAKVQLKGGWLEERIGTAGDEVGIPYEPQEREFEMTASSARDGIVVFALSWEKEYPWRFGRPEPKVDKRGNVTFYDVHTSWKRAVDDIEKVREIEIRHPDYKYVRVPFDFSQLTEFGQNKRSESQEPRLFEEFENAWHREMKKPGVKFCVLDLGKDFEDFGNKRSTRPEFFEKIREKDFGTVYREPSNWFSVGEHPQSECGPYFVYLLQVDLERRSGQIDVNIQSSQERQREERQDRGDRRIEREDRFEDSRNRDREESDRQARIDGEQRREREEAERKAREEEKQRKVEKEREERQMAWRSMAENHPLGIAGETLSSSRRKELGLFVGVSGVVIEYVKPYSAADNAKLRPGMVIESVTHRVVSNTSDLDAKLEGKKSGDQFLIGVWRKKGSTWERATFNVTLP